MEEIAKGNGCGQSCGGACGPKEVPSAEEKEALDALRAIKKRVRALKAQMKNGAPQPNEKASESDQDPHQELERLRSEWETWEAKRIEAARNRMILLGHEDPD